MRKRARTDLRGGRSAMVVPTATVGGSCVVPTKRSKRALGVLIERFTLLFEFSFREDRGFLQGFFDAAGARGTPAASRKSPYMTLARRRGERRRPPWRASTD